RGDDGRPGSETASRRMSDMARNEDRDERLRRIGPGRKYSPPAAPAATSRTGNALRRRPGRPPIPAVRPGSRPARPPHRARAAVGTVLPREQRPQTLLLLTVPGGELRRRGLEAIEPRETLGPDVVVRPPVDGIL